MMKSLGPKPYHYRLPFFAQSSITTKCASTATPNRSWRGRLISPKQEVSITGSFLLADDGTAMSDGLRFYLSQQEEQEINFCLITSPGSFRAPTIPQEDETRDQADR